MNSDSKYSLHEDDTGCSHGRDCGFQHPAPKGLILETAYGSFGPIDVTFNADTQLQTFNRPIASVTIDTTCLNCADILIDFIGILNVTTTVAATSALTFTLFRVCSGFTAPQPLTTTNFFVVESTGGVTASQTLAFRYPFKNEECRGCCTYVLDLTSIFNLDIGTLTYAINGTMSAMAVNSSR